MVLTGISAGQTQPAADATVLGILDQMQETIAEFRDSQERQVGYATVVSWYVKLGMTDQAVELVRSRPQEDQDWLARLLAVEIARTGDVAGAMSVLEQVKDPKERTDGLRTVVHLVSQYDPSKALELAGGLEDQNLAIAQHYVVKGLATQGRFDEAQMLADQIADSELAEDSRLWLAAVRAVSVMMPLADAARQAGVREEDLPIQTVLEERTEAGDVATVEHYLPQIADQVVSSSVCLELAGQYLKTKQKEAFERNLDRGLAILPSMEGDDMVMARSATRVKAARLLLEAGRTDRAVSLLEAVVSDIGPEQELESADQASRWLARPFIVPAVVSCFLLAGKFDRALQLVPDKAENMMPMPSLAAAACYLDKVGQHGRALRFRAKLSGPQSRLAFLAWRLEEAFATPQAASGPASQPDSAPTN